MRQLRHQRRRSERGAAAVEFALVMPILLLLVFGIIDYGAVFADTVSARNQVREGARQGVVSSFGTGGSLDTLRAQTRTNIGAISGTASVRFEAPNGWDKGDPLVVCASIPNPGIIGFVPLPGELRSRVELSIENEDVPPSSLVSTDGGSWAWC